MSAKNRNFKGELCILGSAICGSLLPVLSNPKSTNLSPFWLVAIGSLIALTVFAALFIFRKKHSELKNKKAILYACSSGILIGVIYTCMVFTGSYYTSAQNASIIVSFDVFIAMLLLRKVASEKLSGREVLGGLLLVSSCGALFLPSSTKINSGDLILLSACFITPVGNLIMKKARSMISAETILLIRNCISSSCLCLLAYVVNGLPEMHDIKDSAIILILNGLLVLGLSKILWLEGIIRIPIAKASSIIALSPVLTFIFAAVFLKDFPDWNQIIAIPLCLTGLFFLLTKQKQVLIEEPV